MTLFKPSYKKWNFPAGETGVQVLDFNTEDTMLLDYANEPDIIVWLQILLSYKLHAPYWSRKIFIPYFPYARQDKVHFKGETPFCSFLEFMLSRSLGEPNISIYSLDPHFNKDYNSTIDCSRIIDCRDHYDIIDKIKAYEYDVFVFPDKHAKYHGFFNIMMLFQKQNRIQKVYFNKSRNKEKIHLICTDNEENINLEGKNLIINDDICDGGATFIECAKILKEKGAKTIDLFVTHGIFSKGLQVLYDAGINHIYTTNSYCRLPSNEKLTIIDVLEGLENV